MPPKKRVAPGAKKAAPATAAAAAAAKKKKQAKAARTPTPNYNRSPIYRNAKAAEWLARKKLGDAKLPLSDFLEHSAELAKKLIGKKLVLNGKAGYINEVEAYRGAADNDTAAHGIRKTPRTEIVWGEPARIYIFTIYGLHSCLNISAERDGTPGCVLIRGVRSATDGELIDGPGRVATFFGVTTALRRGVG